MAKTLKLVSKKIVIPQRVYDLEIEDNHNFFANNILIHNCYQEQYMLVAAKIGGQTKAETNNFRRTISKKYKSPEAEAKRRFKIDDYKKLFVNTASKPEYLGDIKKAEDIFSLISAFAEYGFNKSHSICYTVISFREYWLKTYYDAEFNIAMLNNTPRGKEKKGDSVIAGYITEILGKGYKVLPPGINDSEELFSLKSDTEIVWGLSWLKGMSELAIKMIVEERDKGPYSDIKDFFDRVTPKVLNKRVLEALIWSGALDDYIMDSSKAFKNLNREITPDIISDRFDIHEYVFKTLRKEKKYIKIKKSLKKLIELETSINEISMIELKNFVTARKIISNTEGAQLNFLNEVLEPGKYTCIGKIENVEKKVTKTKKEYHRITIRDETAVLKSVFVWPWKCRNWEDTKTGDTICCKLDHDDSGFINLTQFNSIAEEDDE